MHIPTGWLIAAVLSLLCCAPAASGRAENEGLKDLDQATELQLSTRSAADLERVMRLCESALEKGLDEANTQFARQLLASTHYQRAAKLASVILDAPRPDPRWPVIRQLALADLEKAVQHQPSMGAAHYLIARLQSLPGGDKDKARTAVDEAVRLFQLDDQQQARALVLRARLAEDPDKQLADYDKAIQLDPGNADAWQERALFYLERGENEKAASQFAKLLEKDAKNVVALQGAAEALTQLKKYDQALEYADKIIQLEPQSAAGYISRSRIHLLMDRPKDAVADLDQSLRREPGNLAALLMRARTFELLGERARALADIDQTLRLRPNLPQAILLRSMISASDGRFSEAISDLQLLLKTDPKNVDWRLQLAAFYTTDKRPRQAIQVYTNILSDEPDNWQAMRGRGDALLSVGKHAEAIQDYNAALKIQTDDSGLLNNLAWVLATSPDDNLRDGQRSIELAAKACELTSYKASHILSTLAAGYAETGDFETARKWSEKAVQLGEEDLKEELQKELENYRQEEPTRERQQTPEPTIP